MVEVLSVTSGVASSEQNLDTVRAAAAEFARRALQMTPAPQDREEFSRDAWRACAAFGVQGLALPHEYGGTQASLRTTMAVMEGLGIGCEDNGLLFALNAQMWSVELPLLRFGSEEQRRRYLPGLASGELIGAHGMTESGSGSDAFSLATTAEHRGDSYVLNGEKWFITNAPAADLAIIFATVDGSLGVGGISAFIVERGTAGLAIGENEEKMGMRGSTIGRLTFTDCVIDEHQRLGGEGGGAAIFNSSMEWERAAILSVCAGAMQRELDRCIEYAKTRRQFKEPIGRFPAVSNRIADMKVRLEASRALLQRVAELKDSDQPAWLEAAVAKLFISEAWVQSSLDAQLVYGAFGYMAENGIERQVRDSLASRIYSGTSDIQRLVIARWLGL